MPIYCYFAQRAQMSGRLSYNEESVEVSCFVLLKGITRI